MSCIANQSKVARWHPIVLGANRTSPVPSAGTKAQADQCTDNHHSI